MIRPQRDPLERFFEKVDVGLCWEFVGARGGRGYGQFWADGRLRAAHRWLWEHLVGPVAPGLDLDHLCRNPPCVNPDHLEPVTRSENLRRGAGGQASRFCPKGHDKRLTGRPRKDNPRVLRCLICKSERDRLYHLRRKGMAA